MYYLKLMVFVVKDFMFFTQLASITVGKTSPSYNNTFLIEQQRGTGVEQSLHFKLSIGYHLTKLFVELFPEDLVIVFYLGF